MLTANSEGNTDVGNLSGGAALQKDPWSTSTRRKRFKDFIKSCKGKFFQKSSNKKIICVDFDGVINSYKSGWLGFEILPDPPVEGAIEFLFDLYHSGEFQIVIFSSRCAEPEGIQAIKDYLNRYEKEYRDFLYENTNGVPKTFYLSRTSAFTDTKIPAHLYLDDRSLNFNGRIFPSIEEVRNFKSWVDGEDFQKSSLKISKEEYHPNPSLAQKEAGNYKKAHVRVQGFDISVENPKGSYRKGKDSTGKEWKCKMVHHYGYFKRTEGSDGDHIDCFIGPNTKSELVFIINQIRPTSGQFDEHKVMLGFNSLDEAKEGYLANYTPGWKGLGDIQPMTVDQFRTWLEKADTTKKAKEVIIKSAIKFTKSQIAQVGETRTWNDGKVHRKTDQGWVEVSGNNRPAPKETPDKSKTGKSDTPQKTTYEQKAVEVISRWKEFEEQAKIKNKERIAKMKPEERNRAFDIKNASPGDIVRIERPIDGRVNRGHLAKVLDKIDGHLKVMLPSGSIFLFLAADLAFAKSRKKHFWDNLIPFIKGKLAQVGEIRTWSDGNKYRKESNGWRMIGEGENKAVHQTDLDSATKAGISRSEHRAGTEKAMQNGEKIPVKVLREYPTLLDKYPQYKARVSAIDAIAKGLQKGEKVGDGVGETANTLREGRVPAAYEAIDSLKSDSGRVDIPPDMNAKIAIETLESARRTLNFGDVKAGFPKKSYDKLWSIDSKLAELNSKLKRKPMPKSLIKVGKEKERKAWGVLENKRINSVKKQISELKKSGRSVRDQGQEAAKANLEKLYTPEKQLQNVAKKALQEKNGQDIQTQLKIAEAESTMENPPELIPQKGMWQDRVDGLPEQTWQIHFDADPNKGGKPNPERQALHDQIMSDYLSKIPSVPDGEQPIVIMMMGGPASGKSSMVRALGIDESQFVMADADAIKERIPEYRVGVRSRARKAAAMAHEESSYLVKKIRADAMANRKNLVIDGTGAKAKSYLDVIPELRKQGYRIQLLMAECDVDVAVPRAIERAEKVGRFVPENFMREAYPNIPNSFKQISPLVDDFHVFDTGNARAGEKPRALYSKSNGQTTEHDSRWVQRFLG